MGPGLTRRKLLTKVGVAGAGTAAAALVPIHFDPAAAGAATKDAPDRQWAMVIDMRRCDGCGDCTKACQTEHELPKDFEWIKVFEVEDKQGRKYFMPRPCFQCESAPCLKVCPVAATYKEADGVVLVDQDRCIGCRMCMAACPYGARYFNYTEPPKSANPFQHATPQFPVPQQKGTVGKCMFCVHRIADGKLPACVDACGMRAIWIGDLVEDVATNGEETVRLSQFLKENDAFRYKEELNTGPRVYYIAGHGQHLEY
ncbi:MAG TPA: 4Fe-4S dicluster domain-containing protein [Candidatus Limnocylindria bacterium]|nr:4Fe-4S dicluster domain-containing protein [Candidatus Limnocylindria bacterium]